MHIGILGSGSVARAIAGKLLSLGHEVTLGSRDPRGPAAEWATGAGDGAKAADHAQAAADGHLVFNATWGEGAVPVVASVADQLAGKVVVDVSNPLDFAPDAPGRLFVAVTDSLGEQVQRAAPAARVVKALNTVNSRVMVDPSLVPGEHILPLCGDDEQAKREVVELLGTFGWPAERVADLGPLAKARAMEAYVLLWLELMEWTGAMQFNIAVPQAVDRTAG